jgi:hypothetical protein
VGEPAALARPPRSRNPAVLVREAKGPKDKGPKHCFAFYDESAVVASKVMFAAVVTATYPSPK